jgi:hypothetical protein
MDGSSAFEVAFAALESVGLDLAKLLERFLELAGEALAVHAELGEGAVGVGDVDAGAGEQIGCEGGDAVEAPGGVGEFLGEMGFGVSGGAVFIEELAAVELAGVGVFEGRMAVRLVRPWQKALREERALPSGVRGPMECWE